ncbi:NAD(P)/FAD-dependent oxidoreductase [Streptomyces sp. NK08204]|uniref:NAD(P)/FAD-dependent oxidoreductase n=1 Tax=Streptomyces sp. NK08204 TaxID=2873260 RepID=UPI001CEDAFB6|nr:FAD-dependent oxidoreductase [Streptomyces sp. NK08204]
MPKIPRWPDTASVVVVGAGQGGYQTAASLREQGFPGRITLIGAEDALPYERPPLSQAYLKGEADDSQLWLRPVTYYGQRSIDLVTGTVTDIDRAARTVRLADGTVYDYDHLVLATGARPRTLEVPGAGLRGVHTLRTARDAAALRDAFTAARRVVVIGAGLLGLECAAAARGAGREVTVVEAQDRPLTRVASAPTAGHVTRLHRREGTRLLFGRGVAALRGTYRWGRVAEVELTDGSSLPADLVLVAVGVSPRTDLAAAAGLPVSDGIAVDSRLLTADPHISAIGDCAAFPHPRSGSPLRLESVQNAVAHARLVAARLTGAPAVHGEPPWLRSDQFSTTLQIAGLGDGHDGEVVVGDDPGAFSVLLFQGQELRAVESVNRSDDHVAARRLLRRAAPVTVDDVAAAGFTLPPSFS